MSLSRSITSKAVSSKEMFPFVAVPAFEAYALDAKNKVSSYQVIFYTPYVLTSQMEQYLNFTNQHYQWPLESYMLRNKIMTNSDNNNDIPMIPPLPPMIYEFEMYSLNMTLTPWNPTIYDNDTNVFISTLYISPPPPLPISYPYMNMNFHNDTTLRSLSIISQKLNGTYVYNC